ncbi:MAG: response regulator transcription factor [Campylobacterales bacterium]|nr:response regulator transcription factor [Campylobacterales bacterium]
MKILLLEDEYILRLTLKEFLEDLSFEVDSFEDGQEAYEAIYEKHYDILLLDVEVPSMDGFHILKSLRDDGYKIPTIFLTAMTSIEDLETGYKNGCCDYIRKPFALKELELRIMQVYKNFYDNKDLITLGDNLVFDLIKQQLLYKNGEIVLRRNEKEILKCLLKYRKSPVTFEMLEDEVWGECVDPTTIRAQIKNLRKKLPQDIIKNRRGIGYILE